MNTAVQVISIFFMLTMIFIGIWSFVVFIKMHNQLKYRNYILEKLSQNVFLVAARMTHSEENFDFSEEETQQ